MKFGMRIRGRIKRYYSYAEIVVEALIEQVFEYTMCYPNHLGISRWVLFNLTLTSWFTTNEECIVSMQYRMITLRTHLPITSSAFLDLYTWNLVPSSTWATSLPSPSRTWKTQTIFSKLSRTTTNLSSQSHNILMNIVFTVDCTDMYIKYKMHVLW